MLSVVVCHNVYLSFHTNSLRLFLLDVSMAGNAGEQTQLLPAQDRRRSVLYQGGDAQSVISSHLSKEEQLLSDTAVGERLPYNDYTTIDWLHDLVCY